MSSTKQVFINNRLADQCMEFISFAFPKKYKTVFTFENYMVHAEYSQYLWNSLLSNTYVQFLIVFFFQIDENYEDCVLDCSDMCIITSDKDNSTIMKSTCICGDRGTLSLDGLLCQETTLLAGLVDGLFLIGRVFSSSSNMYRVSLHSSVISAMTYDPVHGKI